AIPARVVDRPRRAALGPIPAPVAVPGREMRREHEAREYPFGRAIVAARQRRVDVAEAVLDSDVLAKRQRGREYDAAEAACEGRGDERAAQTAAPRADASRRLFVHKTHGSEITRK